MTLATVPAPDVERLLEASRAGSHVALARLLTRVESSLAGAAEVVATLSGEPRRGRAIGLFGPPGVGKSSVVAALLPVIRAGGATVAVLANDPTGADTGGALLGDRLRMKSLSRDPGVFIRSVAARDPLRSLNATTLGAVEVLTRLGFDYVLVEAVGAGQSDVGTRLVADTNVLVLVPGLGDDVQAMKSGVMEVADVFVVNKADLPDARETVSTVRQAAKALERPGWRPPVVPTSCADGTGFAELLAALTRHDEARDGAPELSADVITDLVCSEVVRRVRRALDAPRARPEECIRVALELADAIVPEPRP